MKLNHTKVFVLAILATATLVGCKKNRTDDNTTAAENEAYIISQEKAFENDVDEYTRSALVNDACNPMNYLMDCVEVTDSGEGEYPREIILDYGEGCIGPGGRIRSGQVIINLSADMSEVGATRTVTFNNFAVNNAAVEGLRVALSGGTNELGQPNWTRSVNMSFTRNGNTLLRITDHEVVWLSGYDTEECGDNVFQITGTGSVTRPNGTVVDRTILIPIISDRICGQAVQGQIQVDAPLGTRYIDFGDGSCDNEAIVIIDGEEYPIDL